LADLATVAPLRVDPGQAADIVWPTNAPGLYQLLVGQCGWLPEPYKRFLADAWHRCSSPGKPPMDGGGIVPAMTVRSRPPS